MESPGTAVAVAPTDDEISEIRRGGAAMIVHRREVAALEKVIQGMEWGSGTSVVKGASFSPQTRYLIADFARITRANILTHIDVLGGKPYLNGNYWKDRIASDPMFVSIMQREIGKAAEAELRALGRDAEADALADARRLWKPPAWASAIYETTITRWMNAAPLGAIQAGKVPFDEAKKWMVEVRECNWAGGKTQGKPDPVGNAEAEKTARTRSLRRCAVSAFSSWMQPFEEQIRKTEEAIEAEWEYVKDEVLLTSGPQAVLGSGEPTAAPMATARALPVRGEPAEDVPPQPVPEPTPPPPPSLDDERKRFFATLRDCLGIANNDGRKAWMVEHGLGDSIKPWTKDDFDRAQELIVAPIRDEVYRLCGAQSVLLSDLSLTVIGKETPEWGKDFVALRAALTKEAEADEGSEL